MIKLTRFYQHKIISTVKSQQIEATEIGQESQESISGHINSPKLARSQHFRCKTKNYITVRVEMKRKVNGTVVMNDYCCKTVGMPFCWQYCAACTNIGLIYN